MISRSSYLAMSTIISRSGGAPVANRAIPNPRFSGRIGFVTKFFAKFRANFVVVFAENPHMIRRSSCLAMSMIISSLGGGREEKRARC